LKVKISESQKKYIVELRKTGEHYKETEELFLKRSQDLKDLLKWLGDSYKCFEGSQPQSLNIEDKSSLPCKKEDLPGKSERESKKRARTEL
jgi:hypothetical protein